MVLEQKYIKDKGYDMEDDFMDALHDVHPLLAYRIGKYIEDNVCDLKPNVLRTHVLGGIIHYDDKPVPFALEMMKLPGMLTTLTNLVFITVDDYLDLINLNSYIKSNETNKRLNRDYRKTSVFAKHKLQVKKN